MTVSRTHPAYHGVVEPIVVAGIFLAARFHATSNASDARLLRLDDSQVYEHLRALLHPRRQGQIQQVQNRRPRPIPVRVAPCRKYRLISKFYCVCPEPVMVN